MGFCVHVGEIANVLLHAAGVQSIAILTCFTGRLLDRSCPAMYVYLNPVLLYLTRSPTLRSRPLGSLVIIISPPHCEISHISESLVGQGVDPTCLTSVTYTPIYLPHRFPHCESYSLYSTVVRLLARRIFIHSCPLSQQQRTLTLPSRQVSTSRNKVYFGVSTGWPYTPASQRRVNQGIWVSLDGGWEGVVSGSSVTR
jgi:hypothetical protein